MDNKLLISEERLKEIIKEELGIAKEVIELTKIIEDKLNLFLKSKKEKTIIKLKDDLKLNLKKFNFTSYSELNDWLKLNYKEVKDGFSFERKTVYLTIILVNGYCDTDEIHDTIQHEVHHYFQAKKSGKSFSSEKYQEVVRNINSDNEYIKYLNQILYFKSKFELEGWINGAYNSFKNKPITTYNNFIENTELYKIKNILKDVFLFFKNDSFNSWYFNSFLVYINKNKLYKETLDLKELRIAILNDCQYTYDMFIRKSSRAFALLKQEYNNKQIKAIQTGFNKDLI